MEMFLTPELSIGDVIRSVLAGHERTCILLGQDQKLMGIVTEGDLLRALWNGNDLNSPISNITNFNPKTISVDEQHPEAIARQYFKEFGILQVPIVDQSRALVRVINFREVLKKE